MIVITKKLHHKNGEVFYLLDSILRVHFSSKLSFLLSKFKVHFIFKNQKINTDNKIISHAE